jgi:basic membrane protein A
MRALALALLVTLALGTGAAALAQPRDPSRPLRIAMLLAPGGRDDKAFNDAALAGLEAAKKRGRLTVVTRSPRSDAYGAAIDELAVDAPDLIIGVGALYVGAFRDAATRYPLARFLLLDAELPPVPNVRSVTFRTDEGSFLAGVVAAVESKRGRVGFVGAMETPAIKAFECGWETGVRWATQQRFLAVRGRAVYIGTTPEAFANPAVAEELSRAMIAQHGVDILYAAAGASGLGVIAAARHAKVKAIGVEVDQRHLAPDTVVTSMRKRLDRAVETAVADVRRHAFQAGVAEMTLGNGGVDLVLPGRLAPATVKLVESARAEIIASRTPACVKEEDRVPAWNFPPRPMTQ